MHYTNFHGQPFLLINKDAGEFSLPAEKQEVDLTMHYQTVGDVIHCQFFNKDGSEAELCGNALFSFMKENKTPAFYIFQTKAGKLEGINTVKELRLKMKKADVKEWTSNHEVGITVLAFDVNVGSKHNIALWLDKKHSKVTMKRNFHSVIQKDNNTFEVRCFERGVGETQACGSGAYAVGVAMMQHFNLEEVNIEMKGGKYTVKKQTLIVKL